MCLRHASSIFVVSVLFGLGIVSSIYYSTNADALEAEVGTDVKAKVGSENIGSKDKVSVEANVNATATSDNDTSTKSQTDVSTKNNADASTKSSVDASKSDVDASMKAESKSTIKSSYQKTTLDSKNSFLVNTEQHLYNPGEEVTVKGDVWSNLISEIGGVNMVKIQVMNNKGTIIYDDKVQVSNDGKYSAKFSLPADSSRGSYTIKSNILVDTGVSQALPIEAQANLQASSKFVVASGEAFVVKAKGNTFDVKIASNSNISNFEFKQDEKKVTFTVEGQTGTQGVTQITIPKSMLSGEMSVMIDGKVASSDDVVVSSSTEAETTLEINYHHSMHTIDITGTNVVPEFPASVLIVMTVGLVTIVLLTKARTSKQQILHP